MGGSFLIYKLGMIKDLLAFSSNQCPHQSSPSLYVTAPLFQKLTLKYLQRLCELSLTPIANLSENLLVSPSRCSQSQTTSHHLHCYHQSPGEHQLPPGLWPSPAHWALPASALTPDSLCFTHSQRDPGKTKIHCVPPLSRTPMAPT